MKVEIRDNGRLEIRLVECGRLVHAAALDTVRMAIEKGQSIKVEKTEDGIALVVEG